VHLGRTFAWDVDFEKRIAALKPAQIQAALQKHIDVKKLSIQKAGDSR